VTGGKFHTHNPQILGVTVQYLVCRVTWSSGFVHPCRIQSTQLLVFLGIIVEVSEKLKNILAHVTVPKSILDPFLCNNARNANVS